MSGRYSDIVGSARLRPALDNYIAYLNGTRTRTSRINTRGARQATKTVFLTPFNFDVPTDTVISSTVNPTHYTALAARINATGTGGEVLESAGSKTVENRPGFSAARIVFFLNATRTVSVARSDITDLQYLKYDGTRYSCPFGRKAADDDMFDAFDAIKSALMTANASAAVKRVSLVREKYSYQ